VIVGLRTAEATNRAAAAEALLQTYEWYRKPEEAQFRRRLLKGDLSSVDLDYLRRLEFLPFWSATADC